VTDCKALPEIIRSVAALRSRVRDWRAAGKMVGVVPTMGALHDGHLSLTRTAKLDCERVIVTIFVNPRQFTNPEDLAKYPRHEAADVALLSGAGVDVVFVPPVEEVYPPGCSTSVVVASLSEPLEGVMRPGHFEGVATVVTKLFGMTMADRAYFGRKDWQQLQVVRKLARDLDLPVHVVGCETIREADGLAMSSRNARLNPEERALAPMLHEAMRAAVSALHRGAPAEETLAICKVRLEAAGFTQIDYIALRDAETLAEGTDPTRPRRLLAAAWLGGVRLIDNLPA